nr:MAG TPA: hypothetical protein [Caudoviricetes sp.]
MRKNVLTNLSMNGVVCTESFLKHRMIITKNPDSDVCGNFCKTLKLFGISGCIRILVGKSLARTDCSIQISPHDFVEININFQCLTSCQSEMVAHSL